MTHPFDPLIPNGAKTLLIGTLPPETAPFYFCNSPNTRLWDILNAIYQKSQTVITGSNNLPVEKKIEILTGLCTGIVDIIYVYDRDNMNSTRDSDINPLEYRNLAALAQKKHISKLLFVYKNALKWFVHSLLNESPIRIHQLHSEYQLGVQSRIKGLATSIECVLLPSPLNRGRKDETLQFKLEFYKRYLSCKGN